MLKEAEREKLTQIEMKQDTKTETEREDKHENNSKMNKKTLK